MTQLEASFRTYDTKVLLKEVNNHIINTYCWPILLLYFLQKCKKDRFGAVSEKLTH
jgi:hypothetical protein